MEWSWWRVVIVAVAAAIVIILGLFWVGAPAAMRSVVNAAA